MVQRSNKRKLDKHWTIISEVKREIYISLMNHEIHHIHNRCSQFFIIFLHTNNKQKTNIMLPLMKVLYKDCPQKYCQKFASILYHPQTCKYQILQQVVSRSSDWTRGCFQQRVFEAVSKGSQYQQTLSKIYQLIPILISHWLLLFVFWSIISLLI
jgi:hypothetical protein